jgi:hypothetical protein
MANKKFSEFTEKTQESEVGKLVGLSADGTTNIQIDPTKIADFTSFSIETTPAGASYIVGLNAAGTQRIKISPDDLVNFSGFSLETTSSGVSYIVGLNAAGNTKIKISPNDLVNFSGFTIETTPAGASYIVGLNAAGNTKIKISPDDLINFNNYPTETNHQNIGFLAGVNLNGDKVKIAQNKVGKSTFTGGVWNGLTYSTVTSPTTGKVWLDRNLGATRIANTQTDSYSFGWLFQYGRKIDDHQLRNSPTTTTQLTGIHNVNNAFVINGNWTAYLNPNCWKADWEGKFLNDVCPPGFRLPTVTEMNAEIAGFTGSNSAHAFSSFLKIPQSGFRTSNGYISSATTYLALDGDWTQGFSANSSSWTTGANYGYGITVRPIKI